MIRMALMTTREAAERIGVSVRHVQRLVASGSVAAVGIDRLDADSVEQWLAQRRAGRVRAWEEATAWGAVALLEGGSAEWLGQSRRSRLPSSLAGVTSAELATRTRNRARVRRYFAHPRALSHLASSIVQSGATDGIGGLTARTDRLDGYVRPDALPRLVDRFSLEPDPTGSVTCARPACRGMCSSSSPADSDTCWPASTSPSRSTPGSARLGTESSTGRWPRCVTDHLRPPTPAGGWARPWPDVAEQKLRWNCHRPAGRLKRRRTRSGVAIVSPGLED